MAHRQKVPPGSATAKADDGELPAGNNRVENQIRPIGIARNNWLFAGSLRAGKRAAAIHEPGALGPDQMLRQDAESVEEEKSGSGARTMGRRGGVSLQPRCFVVSPQGASKR